MAKFDDNTQRLITSDKEYTYRYVVDCLETMELILECLSHHLTITESCNSFEIRDYVGRPLFFDASLYGVLFLAKSYNWEKANNG